jgi:hypothetical protein
MALCWLLWVDALRCCCNMSQSQFGATIWALELLSRKKGPCSEIYSIVTLKSLWTCGRLSNNEYIKLLYGSIWLCDAICVIIVKSLTPSTCHSWVALLAACPVMRLLRMKWPAWSYHPISRCSICGRKKRNGIPTPLTYCRFFWRPYKMQPAFFGLFLWGGSITT